MKKIYFIIFSILFVSNCLAQNEDKILSEINTIENSLMKNIQIQGDSIQKFNILERMEYYKVPGISIAIVKNGKIRWAKGYGYANTKTGTKVDQNTLFQAASISKPIAALATLRLFENDSLELDKDVNSYLKNWQIPQNKFTKTQKVTIQRLLTHTAGITVHGFAGYKQSDKFPNLIDVLNGKGNSPKITVNAIPGSIWRYSGGGYTVMEKIIEDVSGKSFDDYMLKNILLPIGMKNSTFQQPINKELHKNISAAYDKNGKLVKGFWHNYPEKAAAGLWTTPSDLAKYCIEIQDILKGKKEGVLNKKTLELMLHKHKNSWGLGPSLRGRKDALIFGHGGKNKGFTNELMAYAYQGNAVVMMTNADNGGLLMSEIINAISNYYNWQFAQVRTVKIISLSEAELKRFIGKYKLVGENLQVKVRLKDNSIFIKHKVIGNLKLLPLTSTKFIDIESGTRIVFSGDKKVTNFILSGFKFEKIE